MGFRMTLSQKLDNQLALPRCPHCGVARPYLNSIHSTQTNRHDGTFSRNWRIYSCSTCGGLVTAAAQRGTETICECYPELSSVDSALPERARDYLSQAIECLHAPAGAIMLCASAVDAMLKARGYEEGGLYPRIDKARDDHLITVEMSQWAHDVRLEANNQRHADVKASLPSIEDAKRCVDFAEAFGEFLFALPNRIARGRDAAKPHGQASSAT